MNTTTKQRDFSVVSTHSVLERTVESLKANNFQPIVVNSKEEALSTIKSLIPKGASVMNGASATLQEIGFVDYLKSDTHGWNNLHAPIVAESDRVRQVPLRNQALFADYYLGSAHALSETGELVIASNTGSQLPHLVYTSPNIILVVGSQKIASTLDEAFKRLHEHVVPLEDQRMKKAYGMGTTHAKTLILHKENPMFGRNIKVIIVNEALGF